MCANQAGQPGNESTTKRTIVSSIGYEVLFGKIHVDKQETHFSTLNSKQHCKTLSLINMFNLCEPEADILCEGCVGVHTSDHRSTSDLLVIHRIDARLPKSLGCGSGS